MQRASAIALGGLEDIAKGAAGVHSHQRRGLHLGLPIDESQMRLRVDGGLVGDGAELAIRGLQNALGRPVNRTLVFQAVANQVGHGDELEPMTFAKLLQLRHPGHGPSSFMISQITPPGRSPARRARSTAASV